MIRPTHWVGLVSHQLPAMRCFRAAHYVPVVTTVSVLGIMWGFMFHEQGALNYVLLTLRLVGAPVGWLSNDTIALFAIMLVTLWHGLGWYMVMYLAALQSIAAAMQEAAILDGATRWQRFWRIALPLIAPWLATVGILTAVESRNEYIWPSIVMSKPDEFPLSVGVLYLRGTFGSSTRVIAAGTILTILPTLAAFLFTQRYFMRGMDGAVK